MMMEQKQARCWKPTLQKRKVAAKCRGNQGATRRWSKSQPPKKHSKTMKKTLTSQLEWQSTVWWQVWHGDGWKGVSTGTKERRMHTQGRSEKGSVEARVGNQHWAHVEKLRIFNRIKSDINKAAKFVLLRVIDLDSYRGKNYYMFLHQFQRTFVSAFAVMTWLCVDSCRREIITWFCINLHCAFNTLLDIEHENDASKTHMDG